MTTIDYWEGRAQESEALSGSGSIIGEVWRHVKGIFNAAKGVRMNLKPSVRKILEQDGENPISSMRVMRKPLKAYVTKFLNIMRWIGHKPPHHDKLFHLGLIAKLSNGKEYLIEKQSDIGILSYSPTKVDEVIDIQIPQGLTMATLINNAIEKVGAKRIFEYDAFSSNCQRFVMDILESSNIKVPNSTTQFIMQDVKNLVPSWGERITKFFTDLSNRGAMAISGEGLQKEFYEFMEGYGSSDQCDEDSSSDEMGSDSFNPGVESRSVTVTPDRLSSSFYTCIS